MAEKVSIIVPAYNVAPYIGTCVDSLLNQSYVDIEVIVVDDGSTDGTSDILEKLKLRDSRLWVYHQPNGGAAAARNLALTKVTGGYVTFVDGDDALSPGTLGENVVFLQNDAELDWVAFPVMRVPDENVKGNHVQDYGGFTPLENRIIPKDGVVSAYFARQLSELCCGTIYRWKAVKDIRFPEGEYYEDSFYFTDALCAARKGLISCAGSYLYLVREGSSQRTQLDYKRMRSKLRSLQRRINKFRQLDSSCETDYNQMVSSLYYSLQFEKLKGNEGADSVIDELVSWSGFVPALRLKYRLRLALVGLLGYGRLKKVYKFIKRLSK